jgi:thiol-disulfide isomerase/thioredoxin
MQTKKLLLIFSLLFGIISFSNAENGSYRIDVTANQLANQSIYLAGYFNGKIYAFDTLKLDTKGKGIFSKKKKLDEGMYLVYYTASKYFEFMLGEEQSIKIKIDTANNISGIEATGAPQTEAFMNFGKFMTQKKKEQETLRKKQEAAKTDSVKIKEIGNELKKLDDEVIAYQKNLAQQNEGKITGLFAKALSTPQFPENLIKGDMKNKDFLLARYEYAKKHFFDNINIADKRSWRLNLLNQKLDEFTQHLLIQIPDSIIPEAINLIELSKKDSICYNLMTNYMINYSVTSKVMGMDKLFVTLADRYYFTGKAPWADSTLMKNITSEVKKVRYNLIGMQAANLPLIKLDGSQFNIYDANSKYTLVYFFEPTCGHCKEMTPKVHDIYEKYKDKGFEVVCIYLMTDKKEWTDFLTEDKLYDWINVWDPTRDSHYWEFYDTSVTPGVYLLDKDKKIIAKKIDAKSLDKILDFEINGKTMEDNK